MPASLLPSYKQFDGCWSKLPPPRGSFPLRCPPASIPSSAQGPCRPPPWPSPFLPMEHGRVRHQNPFPSCHHSRVSACTGWPLHALSRAGPNSHLLPWPRTPVYPPTPTQPSSHQSHPLSSSPVLTPPIHLTASAFSPTSLMKLMTQEAQDLCGVRLQALLGSPGHNHLALSGLITAPPAVPSYNHTRRPPPCPS